MVLRGHIFTAQIVQIMIWQHIRLAHLRWIDGSEGSAIIRTNLNEYTHIETGSDESLYAPTPSQNLCSWRPTESQTH